jgi:phosphoglucosamine mutase
MYDGGYNFGGENSGHVIFRDEAPTSDGIQTALLFLKALDDLKISPEDAVDFVPLFPSLSCNINVREKVPLEELGTIQDEIETWRHRLGPNGKIFLRYSGTENRLRLLVEGEEEQLVQQIVKEMRNTIESCEKII